MVPERCERFRESISLGLDGMLSTFETALLERHLSRCPTCHAFAAVVTAQTQQLREAVLEQLPRPIAVAPANGMSRRRRVNGLVGAVAVAAAAALVALTTTAGHRAGTNSASAKPLFAVVPAQPTAGATFDVPRLRVVSPASADGPVRGYYGLPV